MLRPLLCMRRPPISSQNQQDAHNFTKATVNQPEKLLAELSLSVTASQASAACLSCATASAGRGPGAASAFAALPALAEAAGAGAAVVVLARIGAASLRASNRLITGLGVPVSSAASAPALLAL